MINMKYLFFDIECSNCFNGVGKMCEFGYVLTDDQFHILKRDDIPMSPGKGSGNRFDLKGRKNEADLELAYDEATYYDSPEFPYYYNQIRRLVEDKDTICFAFSMDNDIPHLYHACKRYKKEPFNYICYDVQQIAMQYLERKNQVKLRDACHEIVGKNSVNALQEHLSSDDAKMEMMILEAMCILRQTSPKTLLDESEFAKTNSIEYINAKKEKQQRKNREKAGHDLFRKSISEDSELEKLENVGLRYNIAGEVKRNFEVLKSVLDYLKQKKCLITNHLYQTDFFVALNEENRQELLNEKSFKYEGPIVLVEELLNK